MNQTRSSLVSHQCGPRRVPTALAVLAALSLAACGGGGGGGTSTATPSSPAAPPEALFVAANAWSGALPPGNEAVTTDEFRRMQAAGELQIASAPNTQRTQDERRTKIEADRAFLESKTDLSAEVIALLAESRASADLAGAPAASLPDGRMVGLVDLGSRIEKAAENYRLSHDPANALRAYELAHALLTDPMKTQVPTPASLRTSTLEQIKSAAKQLNLVLATSEDLDKARLDPTAPVTPQALGLLLNKPTPGNGVDQGGPCTATGIASRYWFPLRYFVSPIKNQGERGTCWAFSAIASVESRERVQNNNPIDLSEQFLVNKTKFEWYPENFVDGGSAAAALNAALDRNVNLMPESQWTYNAASGRPDNAFDDKVAGTAASYVGACTGYSGSCSETAHQARMVCTKWNGVDYCGNEKTVFDGAGGVGAGRVRLIWSSGEEFNLNQYRALLASGVSLIASFPVYEGFMAAPSTGIVSDYSMQMKDKDGKLVNGSYGGHLVQIVGFISNEQLSFPGSPVNVGGGGYFIIRNSWSCAADGGYFYVPADYVSTLFSALEILEFDGRRSAQWDADQQVPGGTTGLVIDPKGTGLADLRVERNFASTISITHPVANYVRLKVTSNVDGALYDGQWLVNPPVGGSLFANALPLTFKTEGVRTLTLTAQYGTQVVTVTKDIIVLNTAPSVSFETIGAPQQGESFIVNAIVTDRNEPNTLAMCSAMTWSVTAPDTILSGSGCEREIRFGTTGTREVRAATQDQEGRAGSAIGSFLVAPPPANPYPRIATYGVYSRDSQFAGDVFIGCTSNRVTNGAVIDLRQLGCSIGLVTPVRYSGSLTLENPTNEVLSYDWTYTSYYALAGTPPLTLSTRTTTPNYPMNTVVFGAQDTAYSCTLDVRVNAPEASRSKTIRVFSGQCIATADTPR